MKCKRTLAASLAIIFALSFGTMTAFAAEPAGSDLEPHVVITSSEDGEMITTFVTDRASDYLDSYAIGISAKGGGIMVASFGVYGTKTMDKIGVYSLKIEEETTPDHWISCGTIYGSSEPDLFYAYDTSFHMGDFTFYATPGARCRVTLTAYAALGYGSDTGTLVSGPKLCK